MLRRKRHRETRNDFYLVKVKRTKSQKERIKNVKCSYSLVYFKSLKLMCLYDTVYAKLSLFFLSQHSVSVAHQKKFLSALSHHFMCQLMPRFSSVMAMLKFLWNVVLTNKRWFHFLYVRTGTKGVNTFDSMPNARSRSEDISLSLSVAGLTMD